MKSVRKGNLTDCRIHFLLGVKVILRNVEESKGQSAWHFLMETYVVSTRPFIHCKAQKDQGSLIYMPLGYRDSA